MGVLVLLAFPHTMAVNAFIPYFLPGETSTNNILVNLFACLLLAALCFGADVMIALGRRKGFERRRQVRASHQTKDRSLKISAPIGLKRANGRADFCVFPKRVPGLLHPGHLIALRLHRGLEHLVVHGVFRVTAALSPDRR